MHPSEIKDTIQNAFLLVDTREQITKRYSLRLASTGMCYKTVKLDEGDYSIETTLPTGEIFSLADRVTIERKMSLDELALCFGKERGRFEREMQRAKDKGKRVYLLIENASLDYLFSDVSYKAHCRSQYNRQAMLGSITSWRIKYDLRDVWVSERNSGDIIARILKKELEIALEEFINGEGRNLVETL